MIGWLRGWVMLDIPDWRDRQLRHCVAWLNRLIDRFIAWRLQQ